MRQNVSENLADFEQLNLNPCDSLSTSEESSSDIMKKPLVTNQEPACDQTVPLLTSMTLDDQDDINCSNTDAVSRDETIQLLDSEETEQLYSEVSNKMLGRTRMINYLF